MLPLLVRDKKAAQPVLILLLNATRLTEAQEHAPIYLQGVGV